MSLHDQFKAVLENEPELGSNLTLLQLLLNNLSVGPAIPPHDYAELDPPAKPTTITYKVGGAGGSVVGVLTLTYSGDDVESYHLTLS
jgi:hypothetical protein